MLCAFSIWVAAEVENSRSRAESDSVRASRVGMTVKLYCAKTIK